METAIARLAHEIDKIAIIDPHSHVNPLQPTADSLTDLLGYHYYTELAHSAGMSKSALEATGFELAERIASHLPAISNTVQYGWLIHLAQTLFGFQDRDLSEANVKNLFDLAATAAADPGWTETVFAKTNLEAIFLTNDFDDPLEGFDVRRFIPCLRTDELVFKLDRPEVRNRFAASTGEEITGVKSLAAGLERLFRRFVAKGARACAVSLPPDSEPIRPGEREADGALGRLAAGNGTEGDQRIVAHQTIFALADCCETFELPFDLMAGVRRNVYEHGVYQGMDLFDQRTSLYQLRRLFNEKPKVVFPVSVLTHAQNQELASFAWIFPNVVASGHWWYANIPAYIEHDLRARLEAAPLTKQIGYYSDAYKLEFVLPKFAMYKRCLARVLVRDFVVGRSWSEERALRAAQALLRDNVLKIFPPRR